MVRQTEVVLRDLPRYIAAAQRIIKTSQGSLPSIRELYSELVQIRSEFAGLACGRGDQYLTVTTEAIELQGVYLGEFKIVLDINRLSRECGSDSFNVRAVDPHPAASNSSVTHPHVSDESICPGDAAAAIRAALRNGRICDAFMMMRSVLLVYNPGSPHVSLDDWGGQPCYECGYSVSEGDLFWCEMCEENFCDECARFCDRCSMTICKGCSKTCPVCDQVMCGSCMTVCDDCGEPICEGCDEEGECPCHDETNQQETDDDNDKTDEKPDSSAVCAAGADAA